MLVKRYIDENEDSFIYRVCEAKTNETWEEIGNYLNSILGHEYSSSKYRKAYQSGKNMIEANMDKFYDIEAQIEELENLKQEIKTERIKNQTVNIERNRVDRQDARYELFYEQVGQYIQRAVPPQLEFVHIKHTNKKYIMTLADIHYGAEFVASNNEYSPKIAKDRFEILLDETINFVKDKGLKELTILGLGDYVQGILRINDLKVNDTSVVKACVDIAQLVIDFLNKLSAYVKITYIDVCYANHSQIRYLGTKANALMDEDLGYIIANYIKVGLSANNRVEVILPKDDETFVEIPNIGFNIIAGHGHQIKNLNNAISDLSMQRHKFYDYLIIGHLHSGKEVTVSESYCNNVEVIVAPSFVGSDPYSDSLFKGCKASVNIYGFEEMYGHTETYKIILN